MKQPTEQYLKKLLDDAVDGFIEDTSNTDWGSYSTDALKAARLDEIYEFHISKTHKAIDQQYPIDTSVSEKDYPVNLKNRNALYSWVTEQEQSSKLKEIKSSVYRNLFPE